MRLFAFATLFPAMLLALGTLRGGAWIWLGLLNITLFAYLMDRLIHRLPRDSAESGEFPGGTLLSLILAMVHFLLLGLAIGTIGGGTLLSGGQKLGAGIGFALYFGQISSPNAHEQIHSSGRIRRALGKAIYISLLFGHHVSAHIRVHHLHVATSRDPNSARLGEGFWWFALRARRGAFGAGFAAESAIRARAATVPTALSHPYVTYIGGALLMMVVASGIAGGGGLITLILLAGYAQIQILLSDYVQHYGLRRHIRPDGRIEPVGPAHAWNAPHWYSAAQMLNAPRHSDHHLHPQRPASALQFDTATMPELPHSLPVMAVIALWPRLWCRLMDPLVTRWSPNPPLPETPRGQSLLWPPAERSGILDA